MLGSAVQDVEQYAPLTCPVCGLEGRSPVHLPVVICPSCLATVEVHPFRPPPEWISLEDVTAEEPNTSLAVELKPRAGVIGGLLFLAGVAVVFIGGGSDLAIGLAAPVAVTGLGLLAWWGGPSAPAEFPGRHLDLTAPR